MSDAVWPIDWQENWDPEVCLWVRESPGHTRPTSTLSRVHDGREASARLLEAAQVGQLDQVDVDGVLGALRQMQQTGPGPWEGCFCWYWEEEQPVDTNASFFIGLNLLLLHLAFAEGLSEGQRALLHGIFADLEKWFAEEVRRRACYYPNKFLGDLVCHWLLLEVLGRPEPEGVTARTMREAAEYWTEHGWGWGEHMSDVYAGVCLNELSALLLFARHLPLPLRDRYRELFAALLDLEDAYEGGPRVPAIRSYSFDTAPRHVNYRDRVRSLAAERAAGGERPTVPNLFAERGWHDLAPPRAPGRRDTRIRCFGGAWAVGHNREDIRLGSMSRFPVMPSADHHTWGLSWQSHPVCLWRPEGDWGYLQWVAQRGEKLGAHPALGSFHTAYLLNALTEQVSPPLVGRTCCLQEGGDLLALRVMPGVVAEWDRLVDRFRLVGSHAQAEVLPGEERWSQLLLGYPEREVSLQCLSLTAPLWPALEQDPEGELTWELSLERPAAETERLMISLAAAEGLRMMVTLWGISLAGRVTSPPRLEPWEGEALVPRNPEESAWRLHWEWPTRTWEVLLDPLSPEPLRPA